VAFSEKSQLCVVHKESETKSFLSILCFRHFRRKIYGFWNEENWQNILCTVIAALHLFSNPDCNPIHIYFDLVGYQVYLGYSKAIKSSHTAWIWIWMTKRPGVTSDGNFSSCLIRRSEYVWLFPFPVGGNGNDTIYPLLST